MKAAGKMHWMALDVGHVAVRAYQHEAKDEPYVYFGWSQVVPKGDGAVSCSFSLPNLPPHQARNLAAALLASADEADKMDDDIAVGAPR